MQPELVMTGRAHHGLWLAPRFSTRTTSTWNAALTTIFPRHYAADLWCRRQGGCLGARIGGLSYSGCLRAPGTGAIGAIPICPPQQRDILLLGALAICLTGKPRHSLIRLVKRIGVSAVPGGRQPVHSAYDNQRVGFRPPPRCQERKTKIKWIQLSTQVSSGE